MIDLNNATSRIEPFGVEIDLDAGTMPGAVSHTVRKASDMRGYYANEAALERLITDQSDPLHYEVFETPVPHEYGHLMFCISSLQPGLVGDECLMTKGHYHTVVETGEIYLCLRGRGYMMMKTTDGESRWEKMSRGHMVYVPPYWAHRSINTGEEPLISYCVFPADAGHNYGDIKQDGFPCRVFLREGKEVFEQ